MGKLIIVLLIGIAGGVLLTNFFEISFTPKKVMQPTETVDTTTTKTMVVAPTQQMPSVTPSVTAVAAKGNIDIELGYPAGGIPPLKVCLFTVPAKAGMYDKATLCVTTAANQTEMTIATNPGNYHIFAWLADAKDSTLVGAWTPAVACGLSVDCKDHSPLAVVVKSDQITSGIEIKDWYTDGKGYPSKP